MANSNAKIKRGMKGSNAGRGRYEKTAVLKNDSKKRRRAEGKREAEECMNTMERNEYHLVELESTIGQLTKELSEIENRIVELIRVREVVKKEIDDAELEKDI